MEREWVIGIKGYNLKFKRETLLNYAMSRWGLNKSNSVGTTSKLIRECAPKTIEEWENYYFNNAKQNKKNGIQITRDFITELGQKLYIKITEVVQKEMESISEEECIDFAFNLIINRTYEGYKTEIDTIYGQLESEIKHKIESAPDKWDRTYGVDFYIKVKKFFIGIQIKPISSGKSINDYQWVEMHKRSHENFTKKYGGKVFFVYSIKDKNKKKSIYNTDVVEEILIEINKLATI